MDQLRALREARAAATAPPKPVTQSKPVTKSNVTQSKRGGKRPGAGRPKRHANATERQRAHRQRQKEAR